MHGSTPAPDRLGAPEHRTVHTHARPRALAPSHPRSHHRRRPPAPAPAPPSAHAPPTHIPSLPAADPGPGCQAAPAPDISNAPPPHSRRPTSLCSSSPISFHSTTSHHLLSSLPPFSLLSLLHPLHLISRLRLLAPSAAAVLLPPQQQSPTYYYYDVGCAHIRTTSKHCYRPALLAPRRPPGLNPRRRYCSVLLRPLSTVLYTIPRRPCLRHRPHFPVPPSLESESSRHPILYPRRQHAERTMYNPSWPSYSSHLS